MGKMVMNIILSMCIGEGYTTAVREGIEFENVDLQMKFVKKYADLCTKSAYGGWYLGSKFFRL